MKRFALISDVIFTFLVSGLFTLCLFRFLSLPLWLAFLLALLCGCLTALSVGAWLRARRKTAFLKQSDERLREKLFLHLALSGERARTDFSAKLLPNEPIIGKGKSRLLTQTEVVFLHFDFAPVSTDDIACFSRYKTHRNKRLFCPKIQDDALTLAKRLDIRVLCGNELFLAAKSADALPDTYLGEEEVSKGIKRRFKLWFAKANARRFLVSAALILLVSTFTPFAYYYLLFAVCLLLAAVFTRIFGRE